MATGSNQRYGADTIVHQFLSQFAVKGFKAKGKRITTFTMETVNELEPTRQPEVSQDTEDREEEEPEILDPDHGKSEDDIRDEITGQMKLF